MKESTPKRNLERPIPLEEKAADLFILASRKYAASVTLQGAEIARICKNTDYHPEGLISALIHDMGQITRIKDLADQAHGKQNERYEELFDKGKTKELKYIPTFDLADTAEVINASYYWATQIYKLPLPEIQSIIDLPVPHSLEVSIKENLRRDVIKRKIREQSFKHRSLKRG